MHKNTIHMHDIKLSFHLASTAFEMHLLPFLVDSSYSFFMHASLLFYTFSFALVASALLISYLVGRKWGEAGRKAAHVVLSFWIFIPRYFQNLPVYVLLSGPFLFFFINLFSSRIPLARFLFKGERTLGLALFPLSLFFIVLLASTGILDWNDAIATSLLMGIPDAMAAVSGRVLGRHYAFGKSIEGSLFFFLSSIPILLSYGLPLYLFLSLALSVVELLSPGGWDNLTVPFSFIILLKVFS